MDEQFQSIDGCYIMSILDKKGQKQFWSNSHGNLYQIYIGTIV